MHVFNPRKYLSGFRDANRQIREVRSKKGTAYARQYAHDCHEHCDKTMNATKRDDRYSYAVGQAGAFGYFASNGEIQSVRFKEGK